MDTPPISPLRINMLIALAFTILVICMWLTVFEKVEDDFAKSAITLVLGRMLGYVDAIYNYEFGTTRGSARKDETIKTLSRTANTIATTAAGGSGTSVTADEVQVDVQRGATVNVNETKGSKS